MQPSSPIQTRGEYEIALGTEENRALAYTHGTAYIIPSHGGEGDYKKTRCYYIIIFYAELYP